MDFRVFVNLPKASKTKAASYFNRFEQVPGTVVMIFVRKKLIVDTVP
jgi:hypothetical protein